MANENDLLTKGLKQSIDNIAKSVRRTNDLLDQFFNSLGKHNLGPPSFLRGTLKKMVRDVEALQNNSSQAVIEIQRSQELVKTLNLILVVGFLSEFHHLFARIGACFGECDGLGCCFNRRRACLPDAV